MPRQLFGKFSQPLLSPGQAKLVPLRRPKMEMLRQRRIPKYVQAIAQLDAGGHVVAPSIFEELRQLLAEQFVDGAGAWPRGWVATCYLGPPFQVHILDIAHEIVSHFRRGEPMPEPLERARSLASHGRYAFVEVHTDKMVAVGHDGSTSICEF